MYIIGGGETVARMSGIPVGRYKYARSPYPDYWPVSAPFWRCPVWAPRAHRSAPICCLTNLAAIVVGGTSLAGGTGGPSRTLIGALIIAILDNGLNLKGVSQYTQMMIKAWLSSSRFRSTRIACVLRSSNEQRGLHLASLLVSMESSEPTEAVASP
jgi:ABC-type glucose/galactose transport system permease subunit